MIPPTAEAFLGLLEHKDAQVLNLLALCRTAPYVDRVWVQGPQLLRRFARLLLKQGHPTLALEVAARGLDKLYPDDLELMHYRALALVNCGNTTRAVWFVRELLKRPDLTELRRIEALSLAGRIDKDIAARTADPGAHLAHLRSAFEHYSQAHAIAGDTFPGINAASLALLVDLPGRSRELAEQVRVRALRDLTATDQEPSYYWYLHATLGEACLLLGDERSARDQYERAVQLAQEAHADGDIASMRRQLLLLSKRLPIGADFLKLFRLGAVVVFAGYGLDRPGEPLCFPADADLEAAVRTAIKSKLDLLNPAIGYCSPGCGSDILFGELMRASDAELHVVLPFAEADFILERLTFGLPGQQHWLERFEKLRGHLRVTQHFATTEEFLKDEVLYDFCGAFMQGLTLTRAAQVGVDPVALVVHDSERKKDKSGLTTFVANWQKTNYPLHTIDLADLRKSLNKPLTATPLEPYVQATSLSQPQPREVLAMLFADVAGFSGLPEPYLPQFFQEFLKIVHQELAGSRHLFANTWGDGLYIVFKEVADCADFALRLLRRLEHFDWKTLGFQLKADKQPGVRIGLHTGPVFKGPDAVLGKDNYFGSHVSRAARIEPVTAPGCAFVSEQFAAALALAPRHDFVCEYLGLQPLAKDYDICPLYRLTRRPASVFSPGRG